MGGTGELVQFPGPGFPYRLDRNRADYDDWCGSGRDQARTVTDATIPVRGAYGFGLACRRRSRVRDPNASASVVGGTTHRRDVSTWRGQ